MAKIIVNIVLYELTSRSLSYEAEDVPLYKNLLQTYFILKQKKYIFRYFEINKQRTCN